MTDNNALNVANYMLESILRDLDFLKENNFLSNQVYTDVTNILPTRISDTITTTSTIASKPPLPTRKSTHSINAPIPQPRETPSFPKLPTRKTTDWQPQQPLAMVMPKVENNEKSSPPPAYSQNPNQQQESLATAEAIYDYQGEDPTTDLSFKQGEIIQVTEYVNDDWWKGTVNGKSGIFPQNHVKKISPPPVKAKRPWAPPKPASFNNTTNTTSSYSSPTLNTMPYSAPPPSATLYTPPPSQPPAQSYVQSYAQPPPVVAQTEDQHGGNDNKVQNMAKKFGGHVATAATWGFGATLGSQAASAIF